MRCSTPAPASSPRPGPRSPHLAHPLPPHPSLKLVENARPLIAWIQSELPFRRHMHQWLWLCMQGGQRIAVHLAEPADSRARSSIAGCQEDVRGEDKIHMHAVRRDGAVTCDLLASLSAAPCKYCKMDKICLSWVVEFHFISILDPCSKSDYAYWMAFTCICLMPEQH